VRDDESPRSVMNLASQRGDNATHRRSRQNNFDILRFLAALAVIVSHAFPIAYGSTAKQPLEEFSNDQTELGSIAVLVFFAISGYLITQSYVRNPDPIRYLKARIFRIIPGLIVVIVSSVLVGSLITTFSPTDYFFHRETVMYTIINISLTGTRFELPGVFTNNPIGPIFNGSLWSLSPEFKLYICVLFLGIIGYLNRFTVIAVWAAAVLFYLFIQESRQALLLATFMGGAIIYLWHDRIAWKQSYAMISLLVLLISLSTSLFNVLFTIIGSYATIYLAISTRTCFSWVTARGDLSYGMYIYAWPVQQMVVLYLGDAATWYSVLLTSLPVILVLAWFSWNYVELTAIRFSQRRISDPLERSSTRSR
jgi:peptidoglycan/LPS O-acetylase OafA/YrhL